MNTHEPYAVLDRRENGGEWEYLYELHFRNGMVITSGWQKTIRAARGLAYDLLGARTVSADVIARTEDDSIFIPRGSE